MPESDKKAAAIENKDSKPSTIYYPKEERWIGLDDEIKQSEIESESNSSSEGASSSKESTTSRHFNKEKQVMLEVKLCLMNSLFG